MTAKRRSKSGKNATPRGRKPSRCVVRILIVTESLLPSEGTGISFYRNHEAGPSEYNHFSLRTLLDALRENPEFFVRFEVTRAHRQSDIHAPGPDEHPAYERYAPHFEYFRFNDPEFLKQFDEVWLFGFLTALPPSTTATGLAGLPDAELAVLSEWMDGGGGVFATGDHDDIGAGLCSRVPRVGTMRKWTHAQGVPPMEGETRNDTNRRGADGVYQFDDESDDVPMPITPRMYQTGGWGPFWDRRFPHPLLCGTHGVIDILPDHPHEGEVIDPSAIDYARTVAFGAEPRRSEYPTANGHQPKPTVVAWASVPGDHYSIDYKTPPIPKQYPVIGAYDGHTAQVGRVVVDSTWHHWMDINIVGLAGLDAKNLAPDSPKRKGFNASVSGQVILQRIQNYYRNVAIWLAPPAAQQCMFRRYYWIGTLLYPLVERINLNLPVWQIGRYVLKMLSLHGGECIARNPLWELLVSNPPAFPGAAKPVSADSMIGPPPQVVEIYLAGGIVRELLTHFYEAEHQGAEIDASDEAADAIIRRGAARGLTELRAEFAVAVGHSDAIIRQLDSAVQRIRLGTIDGT